MQDAAVAPAAREDELYRLACRCELGPDDHAPVGNQRGGGKSVLAERLARQGRQQGADGARSAVPPVGIPGRIAHCLGPRFIARLYYQS